MNVPPSAGPATRPERGNRFGFATLLFFISGFAAFLYQAIWQRALFRVFGSDMQSVTVVVTAFMLGLGVGGVVGGYLSSRDNAGALSKFAIAEFGIAVYGILSLPTFALVGEATFAWNDMARGLLVVVLLLAPTAAMGATLPLLVRHAVDVHVGVGQGVGRLYGANTLGAAAAAFLSVLFLFQRLGLFWTVLLAASLNVFVALGSMYLRAQPRGDVRS